MAVILKWLCCVFILCIWKDKVQLKTILVFDRLPLDNFTQIIFIVGHSWLAVIWKHNIFVYNWAELRLDPLLKLVNGVFASDYKVHNICRIILFMEIK